jgi:hypothetical protein
MESDEREDSVRALIGLFTRTKSAHVAYEKDVLHGPDDDWAGWYARYLLDNGARSIDGWPAQFDAQERLRTLLTEMDRSHQANAPDKPWPEYYARHILPASDK